MKVLLAIWIALTTNGASAQPAVSGTQFSEDALHSAPFTNFTSEQTGTVLRIADIGVEER